jgi:hypothetical protein
VALPRTRSEKWCVLLDLALVARPSNLLQSGDEGTTNFRVSALASVWDLMEYIIQPAFVYGPKPSQSLPFHRVCHR